MVTTLNRYHLNHHPFSLHLSVATLPPWPPDFRFYPVENIFIHLIHDNVLALYVKKANLYSALL